MRRCAVSVSSNIAEGFARRTANEKRQFYFIAIGSTTELENQYLIAKDLGYIKPEQFEEAGSLSKYCRSMLYRILNPIKKAAD